MSKYGLFSGPYFPVFELNTRKYGPEKTLYLDALFTQWKPLWPTQSWVPAVHKLIVASPIITNTAAVTYNY